MMSNRMFMGVNEKKNDKFSTHKMEIRTLDLNVLLLGKTYTIIYIKAIKNVNVSILISEL